MRTGVKGAVFTYQFPLRQRNDWYTKITGEAANFAASVWLNGAADGETVTVAEVGVTGEYKVTFTPDAIGLWELEILHAGMGISIREQIEVSRGSFELLYKCFWNKQTLVRVNDVQYQHILYDDDEATEIRNQYLNKNIDDQSEDRTESSVE